MESGHKKGSNPNDRLGKGFVSFKDRHELRSP
jgi:hypothetical protein